MNPKSSSLSEAVDPAINQDAAPSIHASRFQKTVADVKVHLASAEIFLLKYEAKLPPDLGSFYVGSFGAHFDVAVAHRSDSERERALCFLGDVFGRGGWTAKLEYNGRHFNWSKEVDGVRVKIEGAQPMGQPESFPVDPHQFPIQIEDATA